MSPGAWGLPADLLDQVFPFHLVLGPDLTIRQVGSSLGRLHPQMEPGRALESMVEVVSPRGPVTANTLKSRARSLFVLKLREGDLRLRGQMLHDEASDVVLFVGSPWITDLAAITETGLTLDDFSASDNVVDYLLLLQTQGTALSQARTLADSLQQSASELTAHARHRDRLAGELESVLNSAGEGIYGLDRTGRATFVNEAAGRLTGHEPEELLGHSVHDLIHHTRADGSRNPSSACRLSATLRTGTPHVHAEDLYWRKDGTSFPVEYTATPLEEGGQITGAVVVFRDVSERHRLDRMKDEFVSIVSHELRTPLTSIRGSLGLLASGVLGPLPAKGRRMLEIAVQNTDRLARLINDILDLERINSGRIEIDSQPMSAGDLMARAGEEMSGMAVLAGVELVLTPTEIPVLADCDRILQTLTNLLSNAIKFSLHGGTVHLSAELRGAKVLFKVSDQGRGIPADKLESVFERFEQADSSDSREKGGTGLGLAICRSIVAQHGGRIWVESEPGRGSTFLFTLPAPAPHEHEPEPIAPDAPVLV